MPIVKSFSLIPHKVLYLVRYCFLFSLFFASLNATQKTLNLAITSNPSRINPILSNDSASSEITGWLFNGLFKYDKHGKIALDIAKSYTFLDSRTLVIKLRQDVFWHDNRRLTADDVIFTYETICSKNIISTLAGDFEKVQSVHKIDSYTIKIIYKEPYFKALTIWMVGLLPRHILLNEKDLMTSNFNKNPIGNGPYKLHHWSTSSNIELIANDKFYDGKPHIKAIRYQFLPDQNTAFLMLKKGNLDIGSLAPLQINRQIDSEFKKKYSFIEGTSFAYTYLGFNLQNKKFLNPRIREALSLAINRQEIVDILFFGYAKVCYGPFLPGTRAYDHSLSHYEYNPRKAKELLALMGYGPKKPFEFEVVTNANNQNRVYTAEIIQHQLSKIGVKMNIRVMEWQAFLNTVVTPKKFESIILGWSLSLDPDAESIWHSKNSFIGGFNFVGYKNPRVDNLIEESRSIIDKEQFDEHYRKIFGLIRNDNPYLFLYVPSSITAVSKNIKPIEPSLIGIMHNQKDWIKE